MQFYCICKEAALPKKFVGDPAYFTRRHCVQVDAKDFTARARLHFNKSFFARSARVSVRFHYLVIFVYTGKPDWIIYLNVESKDNFSMVDCEQQFFMIP